MVTTRPHDLLRVSGPDALPADAPTWVRRALSTSPWVVVRRAEAPEGFVPVGIRGTNRSQRHGTLVALEAVHEVVAPEALAHARGRDLPAIRALQRLRPSLDDVGVAWGPTGSVGFELATGQPAVTPDSDLDLLIRTHGVNDALPSLAMLHQRLRTCPTRVDCQVETPCGAVVLAELVGEQPDVLLRTTEGPRLVARGALS